MTQITHHLDDALLMGYSAGTLPEAFNLVVATHISMCDDCRARLGAFDALGGAVLEDAGTVTMDMDAAALLDSVGPQKVTPVVSKPSSDIYPQVLMDYLGPDPEQVKWSKLGMGVRQAILKTSNRASVRLLHIPAGCEMPDHGHHGTELTLVLKGAFIDEQDRFARGDIEIATEDDHHKPVADDSGPCICLAATDAPLHFSGLVQRIAQRWARI